MRTQESRLGETPEGGFFCVAVAVYDQRSTKVVDAKAADAWTPTPHPSPQGGRGSGRRFTSIIQIISLHTLPPVGRVGRASGRGGGLRMLIVDALKGETPQGQRTVGGMEERMESTLPPVFRPKIVPRS